MVTIEVVAPLALFVVGAHVGSFINAVAWRYQAGKSVAAGRSACAGCQQSLRWWELVPLLSFMLLRGRCVRCTRQISVQYPSVELATGVLMMVAGTPLPTSAADVIARVALLCVVAMLVILFLIDLHTFLLPDVFVVGLLGCAMVMLIVYPDQVIQRVLGAAVGTGALFLLWAFTRGRGIGFGDVKLMVPLGVLVGWPYVIMLLGIAFTAGGVLGIVLLARQRATLKTAIPFGPFLIGASFLVLFVPPVRSMLDIYILYAFS